MVRRVPASISCVLASLLIALSTVGAANWEIMLSVDPTSEDLEGIWGTADDDIFAVGGFGTILHYDGSSWNKMESGTEERLYDVWGTAAGDVFAVGNDGVVLHYDGSDWTEMSCDTGGRTLESVWGSDSDDVYAVGYDVIMHYDGDSWGETPGAPYPYAKAVWGTAADDVHVVGYEEALLYDGSTWTETGLGISWYEQYAIWGTAAAGLFSAGSGSRLCRPVADDQESPIMRASSASSASSSVNSASSSQSCCQGGRLGSESGSRDLGNHHGLRGLRCGRGADG